MTRRASARSRLGVGTLTVVMVFLLVIAIMQLAQHFFAGQVTDESARAARGLDARLLAASALSESQQILAKRANDPGDPLFRKLREPFAGTARREFLVIPRAQLGVTEALARSTYHDQFGVSDVTGELHADATLSFFNQREYSGVLTLESLVSASAVRGVKARAGKSWHYRVVHNTLAEPVNLLTLLVRHPKTLVRGGVDANELPRRLVHDVLSERRSGVTELLRILRDYEDQIEKALRTPMLPPGAASKLREALATVRALLGLYSPLVTGPGGGELGTKQTELVERLKHPPFPLHDDFLVVHRSSNRLDVDAVNLQRQLRAALDRYNGVVRTYEAARLAMEASIRVPEIGQVAVRKHQAFVAQLQRIVTAIQDTVVVIEDFKRRFEIIDRQVEAQPYFDLVMAHAIWSPEDVRQTYPSFESRATQVLLEDHPQKPDRRTVTEKVDDLLRRMDRSGEGFSGLILVKNPNETVRLQGVRRGRWALAVQGALEVEDLRRESPEDRFTIIGASNGQKPTRLQGTVQAHLFLTGYALTLSDASIEGTLALDGILGDATRANLRGSVEVEGPSDRIQGERSLQVVFSPWTRSVHLERR